MLKTQAIELMRELPRPLEQKQLEAACLGIIELL